MDASTIQSLKTTRYVTLAAFILYIYDWILVIPQEVHLFRLTRSSVGKHLYYAIRIASLCGMSLMMYHTSSFRPDLSQMSCMVFTWIWPSLLLVTMYACYSLLTLRLVALFRSRKPINYTLYGILFSTLLATFVFQIHVQAKYSSVVNNSEIGLCLPPPPPTQDSDLDWNFAYSFFPPLLVEIALTLLTAYRAFYDLRFYLHTRRIALAAKAQNKEGIDRDIEGTRKKRPGQFVALPTVLYRDGATFSLVVITLRVWNLIILMTQPRTSMYMAIVALWTALATLTTRMYLNLCDVIQREPPPSVHPETRQLALLGAATRHQSLMPSRTSTTITGNFPPSAFGYTTRLSERDSRSSLAYADYRPSTAPARYGPMPRPSTGSSSSAAMINSLSTDGPSKKKRTPAPYVPAYPPPIKREKKTKEGKAARWFGLTSDPNLANSTPLSITTTITTTTTTTTSTTSPIQRRISPLDTLSESGNGVERELLDVQEISTRPYEFYPRRNHHDECDSNVSTPMSTTVRFSAFEDIEPVETSDNDLAFNIPATLHESEPFPSDSNTANRTEQV